ncbi:MAG: VOC family protein [Acidimicrobiia bacterium]|nr:VOC family protein [Acidimicrobiia bacterium]MDH4307128.1 VOC family protein [Acidimicrobiia bacterium]MDH5294024.1 VOC family protein [Acidimicrobiia bacterium]
MPVFDAFGIVVSDLAASLSFYRLLGIDLPESGEGHVEAELPGGIRMMFDTIDVIESFSEWTPPSGSRGIGLAFLCDGPADVDATHARIVAAGHRSKLDPFDAFWGQRYATVLDPDGNPVDLFAPLG